MSFSSKLYLFLLVFIFPAFVIAVNVSERPTGFVQDYAGMLSAMEKNALETKLQSFENSTTNEIAVVTIPSLDGDTIENVAQEIFTKWGIGKKDKNNGVLVLVSLIDRKTRIHTGYGVEGDLTDIATSYIQSDYITPAFREGKYYEGLDSAVDKIIEALGGANIVPENYSNEKNSPTNWELIIFIIILGFQWMLAVLSMTKAWWHGGVLGGVVAGGIVWWFGIAIIGGSFIFVVMILLGLLFDYLVSKSYSKARATGNYPWFIGGGRGGFGGSSGGFGGFGGGGSGGGGSSGSW